MKTIVIYNSIQKHSVKLENCKFDAENDDDKEVLDELCNEYIESNGFYEVDIWNETSETRNENDFFLIFLDDEEPDWKENFDDAVEKLKSFVY